MVGPVCLSWLPFTSYSTFMKQNGWMCESEKNGIIGSLFRKPAAQVKIFWMADSNEIFYDCCVFR